MKLFHDWRMAIAGGPLIAGAFADYTGSYTTGFTVLAVLAGMGSLFFLLARRPV